MRENFDHIYPENDDRDRDPELEAIEPEAVAELLEEEKNAAEVRIDGDALRAELKRQGYPIVEKESEN